MAHSRIAGRVELPSGKSVPRSTVVRLAAVRGRDNECWEWSGQKNERGYGRSSVFRADGGVSSTLVHRVAYELAAGAVPDGYEIDHLCRNRACVNPAHLEAVSHAENTLRGTSPSSVNARRVLCLHGHPLEGRNLLVTKKGHRACRECLRVYRREWLWRKRRAEGKPPTSRRPHMRKSLEI